jgi:hypothetical protein
MSTDPKYPLHLGSVNLPVGHADREQIARLEQAAKRRKVSRSALLRKILEEWLAKEERRP